MNFMILMLWISIKALIYIPRSTPGHLDDSNNENPKKSTHDVQITEEV